MVRNYDRIYVTGDTHADFRDLITKSIRYSITDRDLLIILGDVGINYFGDWRDQRDKDELAMIPATILCVHENHELRPWKKSYEKRRQHIKKQRHYFVNYSPSSQDYGFSSSHIWMSELEYKES